MAFSMVAGLFGGMQKEAQASFGFFCITEDNLDMPHLYYPQGGIGREYIQNVLESDWMPGDIVLPGEPVESGTEFLFRNAPLTITLPQNTWYYVNGKGYDDKLDEFFAQIEERFWEEPDYYQSYNDESSRYITKVIAAPAGYDAWKIQAVVEMDGCFFALYPVRLTPPTPEVRDCELTTAGGTTTWKDYYGKTVWTIAEKEDSITADLNDWAAIPDAVVKAWKESGKDINIKYMWKGYSVSLSIPAGEIARTGEEWYGGEYIAKVNAQYVTVKDWFNQVVSADVLFTK